MEMKYFAEHRMNTLGFALGINMVIFSFVQENFNNGMTFRRAVCLNINLSKTQRNYCILLSLSI